MSYPTYPTFIAFLDANPDRYKNNPEADGYNPTSEIQFELTDRKLIANPEPQGDVPKPLTITELQALISVESLGRLSDSWWDYMRAYISNGTTPEGTTGTREDAKAMVDNAVSRGNITSDEGDALKMELEATIPDPNYQTQVQGPSDAFSEWGLGGFLASYIDEALSRNQP